MTPSGAIEWRPNDVCLLNRPVTIFDREVKEEVIDRSFCLNAGFVLILSLVFSACSSSSSVVSDSPSQSAKPAAAPSTQTGETSAAAPTAPTPAPSGAVSATPSPTLNPIMKQAAAQPGVPVAVPESVRRPLNAEEMQKALQQLPPEVRQRIMGMQKLPTPSPQPTKK